MTKQETEKGIGIHNENCPHCSGGICECLCRVCRPDLWKNISSEKSGEIDYIEPLPTPSSNFSQERINSEVQDKINELIRIVNKLYKP